MDDGYITSFPVDRIGPQLRHCTGDWQANGYGGQYLFVVPSLDLVVAFTGSNYENESAVVHLYMLMESYLLDAIVLKQSIGSCNTHLIHGWWKQLLAIY